MSGPAAGKPAAGRLALGTAQFGLDYGVANRRGQVPPAMISEILHAARAGGIDTLDTAMSYGDSEARLGRAGVADFRVVTKLPALPPGCETVETWVADQLEAALERLRLRRVHALLLHRAEQLLGPAGGALHAALQGAKSRGQVAKIGVSIYDPAMLGALMARFEIDLVQAPFSIIDQRLVRSGWLARLHAAGVEVHARSAFLQGLLLMARGDIPAKFAPWAARWDAWHRWLGAHNIGAVRAALGFVLAQPAIDRVVFGVDDRAQLREILRATQGSGPREWPDLACEDADLVNPARWESL